MEQKPTLHPRSALRGGESRGQPEQHQICCEARNRWNSKGGGQHSFPGGPSPELDCGTNHYYFDLILDTHTFVILNFVILKCQPSKGYKFSFSPNYVKVHYFHYVLTFFSPINLKYIDIESAIKCYVTNVPRHCVVCQSVGSSFVCPFLRCACKLGLAFFRINNSEFIFSREELPMRPMAYVLCIHLN